MNRHTDHERLKDAARARAAQLRREAGQAWWDASLRAASRLAAALRRHAARRAAPLLEA